MTHSIEYTARHYYRGSSMSGGGFRTPSEPVAGTFDTHEAAFAAGKRAGGVNASVSVRCRCRNCGAAIEGSHLTPPSNIAACASIPITATR